VRHTLVEPVARGVWASIAQPDTGAVGNAAIVDLGGESLVFDTHYAPQAAAELRASAEELAGPVRWVVNSHWHADHRIGNAAMPADATIVATERTRALIATVGVERLEDAKQAGPAAFDGFVEELRSRGREEELALLEEFLASLPGLEQRLPDETFADRRELGRVELLTWGGGHTESDAVAFVADERVLLAGDLVVAGTHPWLGDGDPERWLELLDHVDELGAAVVVPGHGAVGTGFATEFVRRYLRTLLELPVEQPAELGELDGAGMYERNLAFLRSR
jgi:glyoxylase-like metal-dependent hydrolase (beta-lactamase superfamily II)